MSRDLTPDVSAAVQDGYVPALLLVELDFPSGALRANNSAVSVDWGGHNWLGLGQVGSVDVIPEHSDLQMTGVSLTLTGIPSEMTSRVLGEHYQGRSCKLWFAPLDADYRPLADPVLVFSGRMDTPDIQLGETASVSLTAESRITDWERPRIRRYTNEDQLAEYPGDRGLEFVAQMVEKTLVWGRTA